MNQDIFNTQLFQKLNTLSDNPLSPTTSSSNGNPETSPSFVPKSFQPSSAALLQQQSQPLHYHNDIPFSQTRHLSISTSTFDPFGLANSNSNLGSTVNGNSSLFFPSGQQPQQQQQSQFLFNNQLQSQHFDPFSSKSSNTFQLPLELQGGISNISSRRPSYTAEFYNRELNINKSIGFDQQAQVQAQAQVQSQPHGQGQNHGFAPNPRNVEPLSTNTNNLIHLDNGLLLEDNFIITSKELQQQYHSTINYFGDLQLSQAIVDKLSQLVNFTENPSPVNQRVSKILKYLKFKNEDLKFQTKNYTLILNKNNKVDLISIAKNSNLKLLKNDLIIIEGDRGKDLVLVLEPLISLNFAILFNYLKKKLHLKSLTFGQEPIINNLQVNGNSQSQGNGHGNGHGHSNGNHNSHNTSNHNQHQQLINEDENFITLPNKQILRFVKPFEINQLYLKFNDELMTLKLCLNYILNLNLKLIIRNVEFQFDKKKIIIYYYCNKRLDFRGLIKELFKIYKTRIWLCAILPHDNDAPYIFENFNHVQHINDLISLLSLPRELSSINDLSHLKLEKFHGEIFMKLIKDFENDLSDDEKWNGVYHEIEKYSNSEGSNVNSNGNPNNNAATIASDNNFNPPAANRSHKQFSFSNSGNYNRNNGVSHGNGNGNGYNQPNSHFGYLEPSATNVNPPAAQQQYYQNQFH